MNKSTVSLTPAITDSSKGFNVKNTRADVPRCNSVSAIIFCFPDTVMKETSTAPFFEKR